MVDLMIILVRVFGVFIPALMSAGQDFVAVVWSLMMRTT